MKFFIFFALVIVLISPVDSQVNLAPGELWANKHNYTVQETDLCAGWINNTADARGLDYCGKTVNSIRDAEWSIRTEYHAAASLSKISDKSGKKVYTGDVITYTYSVKNIGDVNLTIVSIVDNMLGPIDITDPLGDRNGDGWLNLSEVWTFTASYEVQERDLCSKIINSAELTALDPCNKSIVPRPYAYAEVETACNEWICPCCQNETDWEDLDVGNQKALALHNGEAQNNIEIIIDQSGEK